MRSRPGELQKPLTQKTDRVDWERFSLLENLLVFRVLPELTVPPESGVKFRISREQVGEGVCLLIRVDHPTDPVFAQGSVRPDYMALYLHGTGCICTIIEMKGKSVEEHKHAVEQIEALRVRLKEEFRKFLLRWFQIPIQGLLVSPTAAQTPLPRLKSLERQGFTILPVKCDTRAELFPYISKLNRLDNAFRNQPRHPARPGPLEELLAQRALPMRLATAGSQRAGEGLHIDYALSGHEYASLTTRGRHCIFTVKEDATVHADHLRQDLEQNGLTPKFLVEAAPNGEPTT